MSNTAVIEGRCDVRYLASCAYFFAKQGLPARTKSELMAKVLTTFAEAAIEQGAKRFETTSEAMTYMFSIGLGPVNRVISKEGKRANNFTLSKVVAAEEATDRDSGEYIDPKTATKEDWLAVAKKAVEEMRNK
jgi:threonine synthase